LNGCMVKWLMVRELNETQIFYGLMKCTDEFNLYNLKSQFSIPTIQKLNP
jgi:hypothetical protein